MHNKNNDELLDLVDDNDTVIGQERRSKIYEQGLSNFRVVNAFLENSEGKIWILRRSARPHHLFPLALDMSVGGHVRSGETYDQALRRELKEELDMDLDAVCCHLLGYLTPHEDGVSAFTKVYIIKTDKTPNYNTFDFVEGFWLTPQEVLIRIQEGERSKDDLPILVRRFWIT